MRVVIIDDEVPALRELRFLLEKYEDIEVVGEGYDGEDLEGLVEALKPDAVFLDIHMANLDGVAAAFRFLRRKEPPFFVFATGYDEYAVQAFEANAVDYILKPFSEERLDITIQRLRKGCTHKLASYDYNQEKMLDCFVNLKLMDKIAVWDQEKIKIIDFQEILYVTVEGRQSVIITEFGRFFVHLNLKELEVKLPKEKFFRTHRAFIINLENIDEISLWFNNTFVVRMKNCRDEIPVSRTFVKEFRNAIGL